jgi:inosose dehydratase
MSVRIGVNPIMWSNDDLRSLGGETALQTCLRDAREAGYEGIELGHKFPRSAKPLAATLGAHGLALVSGWYSAALLHRDVRTELAAMRPHLDLLKAFGCRVLILCDTTGAVHGDRRVPLSARPVLTDSEWKRLTLRLTELAQATVTEGVQLAYHPHMGTVVQTGPEIDRLMAETEDSLKLLLDTGHLMFAGADPAAIARRHHGRIAHVHLKDVRLAVMQQALEQDVSFLESVIAGVFTVPSDGDIDFAAVMRSLMPYDGWLVVEAEQDPVKAPPLTYAKTGAAHVFESARRIGLIG